MYCQPCQRERPATSRFCVLCGSPLFARPTVEVEADLARVRWLLQELEQWDDLAPVPVRVALRHRYEGLERVLLEVLAPPPPLELETPEAAVAEAPVQEEAPAERLPVEVEAPPPPARAARPPKQGPSAWERLWKPLLGESVGWFIGAFLILAGTFTFVADAWASMNSASRALTVFGLAVFWTLGFAGWAHMLSRREATRPASVVLWRIAAALAPLATVALGPLVATHFIAWPLLLAQAIAAGLLAHRVARDAWAESGDPARARAEALALAVAMGGATAVLGAAPVLTARPLGWLELFPVVLLLAIAWRHGPLPASRRTGFSLAAMAYALVLSALRLHVAALEAGGEAAWGVHSVALSAFALAALEFLEPGARLGPGGAPRTPSAADAFSVSAVAAQTLVLWPAFFSPAPAFVLGAVLAAVTTARLARRPGPSPSLAARWLAPTYVFGYVAFQRIDQLVPAVVVEWYGLLKASLGYAAAPLPASYASVYAALYVVAVALAAARWRSRGEAGARARAEMLLGCTTWGALVFGALALGSLADDPRPAVLALPVLTATTLGLGLWLGRADLARAGAALSVAAGVSLFSATHLAWPLAAVALAATLLSVPALKAAREALSAAAMLLVALAVGAAFLGAPSVDGAVALLFASVSALLVARNLDDPTLLAVACFVPPLAVVRFGSPWGLGAGALAAIAALPSQQRSSRLLSLVPAALVMALAGPAWEVLEARDWPTATLVLGGVALVWGGSKLEALERRPWSHGATAVGLLFLVGAMAPLSERLPFYQPWHAQALAAAAALAVSVDSVRKGRSWQRLWLAGLLVALGVGCAALPGVREPGLVRAAVVALFATAALWPIVTVPLASALLAVGLFTAPVWLLAVAVLLSVAALLEGHDVTWRRLLNRTPIAWVASVCAALVLICAMAARADLRLVFAAAAVLPLAWTRGTRHGAMLALGLALAAAVGVMGHDAGSGWLLGAGAALSVIQARLVLGTTWGRHLVQLPEGTSRLALLLVTAAAGLGSGLGLGSPWVSAAWAVASLLVGGELPALNLAFAAAVAAPVVPLQLPAAWGLMLIAALVRFAPRAVEKVLGWTGSKTATLAASASAVVVAVAASAWQGGLLSALTLPLALFEAGGLLGWWGLWAAAVVAGGVDLRHLELAPWAPVVATASAAAGSAGRLLGRIGTSIPVPLARPWWWGSAALVLCSFVAPSAWWLLPAALLLVTWDALESAVGTALGVALVVVLEPRAEAGLALSVLGASLSWLGAWRDGKEPVARSWFHAGWMTAVAALVVVGVDVREVAVPLAWVVGAASAWAVAFRKPALEWLGWAASWLSVHVVVVHVGAVLATGAPEALILPYFALVSSLMAVVALWRDGGQARPSGLAMGWAASVELLAALSLVSGPFPREAAVAVVAGALLVTGAGRRAIRRDDGAAAWLAQAAVAVTVLAARRLGAGAAPDLFEAWAAMVWGTALWGLALFVAREDRPSVARALRGGAVAWPLLGLVAAPWESPGVLVLLLLVVAGHYAWLAGTGLRRVGAAVSAVAFNAAMVAGFFASGWDGAADLALPGGLSVLALSYAFRAELGRDVQVKLRAVAMAVVYAAASWRPLTFTTAWGLFFSVVVCVAGVAAGAALRIRSFVLVGTAFLVTSVVATLVRQGLAEPRLGAILLALLGLGVVAFMVGFTTRRAELNSRLRALRAAMSRWEG